MPADYDIKEQLIAVARTARKWTEGGCAVMPMYIRIGPNGNKVPSYPGLYGERKREDYTWELFQDDCRGIERCTKWKYGREYYPNSLALVVKYSHFSIVDTDSEEAAQRIRDLCPGVKMMVTQSQSKHEHFWFRKVPESEVPFVIASPWDVTRIIYLPPSKVDGGGGYSWKTDHVQVPEMTPELKKFLASLRTNDPAAPSYMKESLDQILSNPPGQGGRHRAFCSLIGKYKARGETKNKVAFRKMMHTINGMPGWGIETPELDRMIDDLAFDDSKPNNQTWRKYA